mgnify:CR=1 FL=1
MQSPHDHHHHHHVHHHHVQAHEHHHVHAHPVAGVPLGDHHHLGIGVGTAIPIATTQPPIRRSKKRANSVPKPPMGPPPTEEEKQALIQRQVRIAELFRYRLNTGLKTSAGKHALVPVDCLSMDTECNVTQTSAKNDYVLVPEELVSVVDSVCSRSLYGWWLTAEPARTKRERVCLC